MRKIFLVVLLLCSPFSRAAGMPDFVIIDGLYGTAASAGICGLPCAVANGSLVAGMAVGYWSVCPVINGITQSTLCTDLQACSGSACIPPAPSAFPTKTPTNSCTWSLGSCGSGTADSYSQACSALVAAASCPAFAGEYTIAPWPGNNASHCTVNIYNSGGSLMYSDYPISGSTLGCALSCPAGYTLSQSLCYLTNPDLATDSGRVRVLDGGGGVMTVTLADGGSNAGTMAGTNTVLTGGTAPAVTIGGTSNGRASSGNLNNDGSGSSCMIQTVQKDAYTVTKTQVCIDSNGVVTSTITWDEAGPITINESGVPSTSGVGSTDTIPVSGVTPGSGVDDSANGNASAGDGFGAVSGADAEGSGLTSAPGVVASGVAADTSAFTLAWTWYTLPNGQGASACPAVFEKSGGGNSQISIAGQMRDVPSICDSTFAQRLPDAIDWLVAMLTAVWLYVFLFKTD
ncbi:MAG: hypothetical protein H7836_15395 [Magnetococcus sp. YQC-3]